MTNPGPFKSRSLAGPWLGVLGVGTAVLSSNAAAPVPVVLSEGNAVVNIDAANQTGMHDWFVDGQDYLAQQWLWYRTGTSGPEYSIDKLSLFSISQPAPDQATILYNGTGFNLEITYSLTGGPVGSGVSDIAESIKVSNTSASPLDFHLFLYSDFDLNGTAIGDTVTTVDYVPFPISSKGYRRAVQVEGLDVVETTVNKYANRAEAELAGVTLGKLNDGDADSLLNTGATFGPSVTGDMTFAFQWDASIAVGGSQIIIVDKRLDIQPIPEPTTAALSLLGLAAVLRASMRRKI